MSYGLNLIIEPCFNSLPEPVQYACAGVLGLTFLVLGILGFAGVCTFQASFNICFTALGSFCLLSLIVLAILSCAKRPRKGFLN